MKYVFVVEAISSGRYYVREAAERESLVRERSVLVHDVHRAAFNGQRNAQLGRNGLERVVEALQIGARRVVMRRAAGRRRGLVPPGAVVL